MLAYQCGITKDEFIAEIKRHMELDDFVKGSYGHGNLKKGRGCAVGCSIKSINRIKDLELTISDHSAYEKYLGIPEWLAYLEDRIFEELPDNESKEWPLRFSVSINIGVNLNLIFPRILIWITQKTLQCFDNKKYANIANMINDLKSELSKEIPDEAKLRKIRYANAANAAAYATANAAAAAAAAAATAAAAVNAAAAATAAAAAANAAYATANAAAYAYANAEREKYYIDLADELIRLIEECK